jgi:hypothetical protein
MLASQSYLEALADNVAKAMKHYLYQKKNIIQMGYVD